MTTATARANAEARAASQERVNAFKVELTALINKHDMDAACGTPDFILAQYLAQVMAALATSNAMRDQWFERAQAAQAEAEAPKIIVPGLVVPG